MYEDQAIETPVNSFSNSVSHTKYRPDIDGLRAVAIFLVVGFHAFPDGLKGGFVGVDVFFVISGYLITGIILTDISRKQFSFQRFYAKRIRRIFPALILVLTASFGVGWFVLLPDELQELGKHMAGGAGFVSNFILWKESGYFDNQAELKPLLHLWSLAIEEQFYFIWPLLLVLFFKLRFSPLWLLLVVMAASFLVNAFSAHIDPVSNFYSPLTRFWELMAGALLAYLSLKKAKSVQKIQMSSALKNTAAAIGCVLITAGVVCLDKNDAFPGWWALLPVLGTCLLIVAETTWLNQTLLAHPAMVFIGLVSFPLYLWHWPVLSFARIMALGAPTPIVKTGLVLASIILAWITSRFVEKPLRTGQISSGKTQGLCCLLAVLFVTGYGTLIAGGFPDRMQDKVAYSTFFADKNYTHSHNLMAVEHHECNFYDIEKSRPRQAIDSHCYTPQTKNVVFLWGDSHAQHLNHGLAQYLTADVSLLQAGASGCPPTTAILSPDPLQNCNKANQFVWQKIQAIKPNVVILAQQKSHEKNNFDDTIQRLKAAGVQHVVLIGPVPQWQPFLYKIMLRKHWSDYPNRMATHLDQAVFQTDRLLQAKYQQAKHVTYVSLVNLLCNQQGCITYLTADRKESLITYDYGHFTLVASDYVAKTILMPIIRQLI